MPLRCYYDTGVFLYFFFVKEDITQSNDYYYLNSKLEKHISLFVLEEFLHTVQRDGKDALPQKYQTEGAYKTFIDVWDKLDSFVGPFKQTVVDLQKVKVDLYKFVNMIRLANIDLIAEQRNAIEFMDWFHLLAADQAGCNTFLTTDTHFNFLRKLADNRDFKFKYLQNIIPLTFNKETLELEQKESEIIALRCETV